jgi:hypothetical protein
MARSDSEDPEYNSDSEADRISQPDELDQMLTTQREYIAELQKVFASNLADLHQQFKDFSEESEQIQNEMMDRIRELKAELERLRKKSVPKATLKRIPLTGRPARPRSQKKPRKLAQRDDGLIMNKKVVNK